MTLELGQSIIASPDVYWAVADGSLLLFSQDDRRLHVLNETAASVWALSDTEIGVSEVVDRMAATYRKHPSDVRDDVVEMLDSFVERGLCMVAPSAVERNPEIPSTPRVSPPGHEPDENTIGPLRVLGSSVCIDIEDHDLAAEVRRVLAPLERSALDLPANMLLGYSISRRRDKMFEIVRNGEVVASLHSRQQCLRALLSDLNSAPLDAIDDALVLHAAAAEIDGDVLALAGVSNAGKSTLVAQLVERGGRYLTDEALVVALDTFDAQPFTKSICIDAGAQTALAHLRPAGMSRSRDSTWDVDPRTIGPGLLSGGGPIRAFVFPIYRPRCTDPTPRRLEPLECVHRLLRNTFDFSSLGQAGFTALVRMATEIPAWELAHGGTGHLELVESLVKSALVSP